MKYEIAGQDVASFIKEHGLSKKYGIHQDKKSNQDDELHQDKKIQDELKHMESGYVDAGLIMKFLKVAVGEKDKFSPEARREIETIFEPALKNLQQIKPEIVEIFINSGILDRALGDDIKKLPEKIELIIRGNQQLKEVGTALHQGAISKEEAESTTSAILNGLSKPQHKAAHSIKQIIDEGKQPNRGGRGELGS